MTTTPSLLEETATVSEIVRGTQGNQEDEVLLCSNKPGDSQAPLLFAHTIGSFDCSSLTYKSVCTSKGIGMHAEWSIDHAQYRPPTGLCKHSISQANNHITDTVRT